MGCGIAHRLLGLDGVHEVHQARVRADDPLEGFLDDVEIGSLKVLAEEVRRHFDRQGGLKHGHRPDRFEPGLELLGFNQLLDDAQAIVPYVYMSILNLHRGLVRECKNE